MNTVPTEHGLSVPGAPPHLSPAERAARGRAARAEVPRSSHAHFEPVAHRTDPVELLQRQAESRVPELVPIRYGRMLVSAFTFYRGAALIMANDLAATPRSGLNVQLCGDAHLSNFGVFASPERTMLFDLNDFDETLPGPWEWDVKRLAASLAIAGRDRNFSAADRATVVQSCVARYRTAMREFAGMRNLDVWYSRMDIESLFADYRKQVDAKAAKFAERNLAKARTKDSMQVFSKLTTIVDGEPRIAADPPLIVPARDLVGQDGWEAAVDGVAAMLADYVSTLDADRRILLEEFRVVDLARKVVGVGSVGTRAWIVLMMGRDESDPLFLQVKEAEASVLEEYVGASTFGTSGERVVVGQRVMQAASDILLGWNHGTGLDGKERDFYIRQLKDWKGSAVIEEMRPRAMTIYGALCGWTLARAHARSGDRIAIAAYLGKGDVFDRAIAEFSEAYADLNERDYAALAEAVKSGRIEAQTGL